MDGHLRAGERAMVVFVSPSVIYLAMKRLKRYFYFVSCLAYVNRYVLTPILLRTYMYVRRIITH